LNVVDKIRRLKNYLDILNTFQDCARNLPGKLKYSKGLSS